MSGCCVTIAIYILQDGARFIQYQNDKAVTDNTADKPSDFHSYTEVILQDAVLSSHQTMFTSFYFVMLNSIYIIHCHPNISEDYNITPTSTSARPVREFQYISFLFLRTFLRLQQTFLSHFYP